jgi:cytochrome c-type biogenesis protein CcmF
MWRRRRFRWCQGPVPPDGNGLNPLLQYPEMVIHPPMLYLGYVGFSVPFAFALGALMMRYPGEKWIHITRRWTMVTWLFLTVRHLSRHALGLLRAGLGRLLGLGPGGERFADAVADGHRLPALGDDAGEARHDEELERVADLLHLHARDFGHAADALGLVSSVHAFAQSAIGTWFWVFLVIVLAVCLFTLHPAPRPSEVGAQAGVAGLARVELPVQQPRPAGRVLHGAVGNAVSGAVGVRAGQSR